MSCESASFSEVGHVEIGYRSKTWVVCVNIIGTHRNLGSLINGTVNLESFANLHLLLRLFIPLSFSEIGHVFWHLIFGFRLRFKFEDDFLVFFQIWDISDEYVLGQKLFVVDHRPISQILIGAILQSIKIFDHIVKP